MKDKVKNVLLGFVLGDCWGVPFEFQSEAFVRKHFKEFAGHGTHNQLAGTWSDDTAMLLTTLEAIDTDYNINIEKCKKNLKAMYSGKYFPDNVVFDIGNGTRKAIVNDFKPQNSLGNGAFARILPIPLIEALTTQKISQNTVIELISLTHTANSDMIACVEIYSNLIKGLLINDIDLKNEAINQFNALMIEEEFRYIAETEKGSAYGTLKILIEEYKKSSSLQDVIKLGGDTDSNGAFYGALYYATREFPTKYVKKIRKVEVLQMYVDRI